VSQHDLDELAAYALAALGPDEAARVEHHLRSCADCRAELAELRQVSDELDRLPVETFVHEPPEGERALRRAVRRMRDHRGRPG
jgi:anti-sigma factor RsiW